jgi:hypothetical protein
MDASVYRQLYIGFPKEDPVYIPTVIHSEFAKCSNGGNFSLQMCRIPQLFSGHYYYTCDM